MAQPSLVEKFLQERQLSPLSETAVLYDYAQDVVVRGPAAIQAFFNELFGRGFPAAELVLLTGVADERVLVLEFTLTGCQAGNFWGLPQTGRTVVLSMALIGHLRDGFYDRITVYYDAGSLLRQLGLAL